MHERGEKSRLRDTAGTTATTALAGIMLLAAACSGGGATVGPTGATAATATTGSPSSAGLAAADRRVLAARYLAIATAGNRRLEIDFDGLHGRDRGDLAAARGDLLDAAATERLFDRRLLAIAFPAAGERIARALFWLNESRAALTSEAAMSRTLAQLRSYDDRLSAANGPVELAVRIIRSQLGLPPPETS